MTPAEPLPLEISLLRPPTFPKGLTRFGNATYASQPLATKLSKSREIYGSVEEELNAAASREIAAVQSIYGNESQLEKEIERERTQLSMQDIKEYAVPVQPRRYLPTSTDSSLLSHQSVPVPQSQGNGTQRYNLRSQAPNAAEKPRGQDIDMEVVDDTETNQTTDLKSNRVAINN